MLSPDYSGIWRNGHSTTYDVTNFHVSRFLWCATCRVWIDLSTGVSILNIDCIPTELIEKKTWSVFGVKLVQNQASIPVLDHGLFSRVFHWLRSKLFRPVEGVHRVKVERRRKQRKTKRKGARKKIGTVQQKIQQQKKTKKQIKSKFWLVRKWILAKFREILDRRAKKID